MKKGILAAAFLVAGVITVAAQEASPAKKAEGEVKTATADVQLTAEEQQVLQAEAEKKDKALQEELKTKNSEKQPKKPADVLNNKTMDTKKTGKETEISK